MTHSFLDSPSPIAFAHRGGSWGSENALSAFQAVQRLGYRYIETDVRASRDGVAFVFHDENLSRMTGFDRAISDLDAAEIRGLVLPAGDAIPTLEEALERFPDLRFNIDLKDDRCVAAVVKVVEGLNVQRRVCITSFSERRVVEVRRLLGPTVCTGLGVGGTLRTLLGAALPFRLPTLTGGAAVLQVPFRWHGVRVLNAEFVKRANDAGLAVHVWTLNDRPVIEAALNLGVDGVMTDQPRLLKGILEERGLWKNRR